MLRSMKSQIMLIALFSYTIFGGSIKEDVQKMIDGKYEGSTVTFKKYSIPMDLKSSIETKVKQRFFKEELYVWKIEKADTLYSVFILDNVLGKSLPITFLVEFNSRGFIIDSEIVKYRETHGGAVQNRNWQNQFVGKNSSDLFSVGSDIDGITGATISANSITKGIKKLSLLVKEIINAKN